MMKYIAEKSCNNKFEWNPKSIFLRWQVYKSSNVIYRPQIVSAKKDKL